MTEEIIIDGVNVAGCEYMLNNKIKGKQHCPAKAMPYAKETSCICRKSIDTPYNFCKHNPNCHYKQLKRLEQENKDLKKQIESDKGLITIGGKQQYDMTMAYDKYKTALEEIRRMVIDIIEDNGRHNLSDFSSPIRIEKIINEVLDKG